MDKKVVSKKGGQVGGQIGGQEEETIIDLTDK